MAENQTLRNLLKNLAGFIGDGAGGLLPKLGWDLGDFNDFINKSETDTAWEGFHRRKKHNGEGEGSSMPPPVKRPADSDQNSARAKKRRSDDNEAESSQNGFSLLSSIPSSSIAPPPSLYPPASRPQERNPMFSELMRGSNGGSPMFMQPAGVSNTAQYSASGNSNIDGYQSGYMANVNINMDQRIGSSPYDSPPSGSAPQSRPQQPAESTPSEDIDFEDDPKKNEAYKLIRYEAFTSQVSFCSPTHQISSGELQKKFFVLPPGLLETYNCTTVCNIFCHSVDHNH